VDLGPFEPTDVNVQLYYGTLDSRGEIVAGDAIDMEHCCPDQRGPTNKNVHEFFYTLRYNTTGKRGFSVRVLPNHDDLGNPFLMNLITWA
jgi:starch phosphorylase